MDILLTFETVLIFSMSVIEQGEQPLASFKQ